MRKEYYQSNTLMFNWNKNHNIKTVKLFLASLPLVYYLYKEEKTKWVAQCTFL